ncbi:unnamed protein product [Calypogeia fissa]
MTDPKKESISAAMKKARTLVKNTSHLGRVGVHGFKFRYETIAAQKPKYEDVQEAKMSSKGFEKSNRVQQQATEDPTYLYQADRDATGILLTKEVLKCFKPEEWLSDVAIEFYFKYLQRDERDTQCYVMSPFWYTQVASCISFHSSAPEQQKVSLQDMRGWIGGVEDVSKLELILIPVHGDLHWSLALAVLQPKFRTIRI